MEKGGCPMDKILALRNQIRNIDQEMKCLFLERLQVAKEIGAWKRAHGMPVLDAQREKENIETLSQEIEDWQLRNLYTEFLTAVMHAAKEVQR